MNSIVTLYVILNTFFSLYLYYGFFQGVERAQTIAYFIAWVFILIAIGTIFLNKKFLNSIFIQKNIPTLLGFVFISDLFIIAVFIHANSWLTVGFYVIRVIAILNLMENVNRVREADIKKQKDIEKHNQQNN